MKNANQESLKPCRFGPTSCRVATTRTSKKQVHAGLLILLAISCASAAAQTNEWTWMDGSVTAASFGTYGTLGTPDASNNPGARGQPASWTDSKGNFWLFGGYGFDSGANAGDGLGGNDEGYLNDLWEFNPKTNEWAWMGGSSSMPGGPDEAGVYGTLGTPAAGNIPPGRSGSVSWTDTNGNLWLFGGSNESQTTGEIAYFNDLWMFSPSTNQWAWMGGSNTPNQPGVYGKLGTGAFGNIPGARSMAVDWTDGNGNVWLFGGVGSDSAGDQGSLDDLWEFSPSANQWTWVSGSNTWGQPGVPGTLGTPAAGNLPAARNSAVSWIDSNQNLWLFGGATFDLYSGIAASGYYLNDLWEFNPTTSEWVWMGGSTMPLFNQQGQAGVYGALETPAAGNMPGSRSGAVSWTDKADHLWMFGGEGYDSEGTFGSLNDLWEFNPTVNEWAWMGGGAAVPASCPAYVGWCGDNGVFGMLQMPALGNAPSARYESAVWTDNKGNFWLFGGDGFDSLAHFGFLSDLWEFQPNTGGQSATATPEISPGSETISSWQTVTITDTTPGATINYLIDGSAPALGYTGPITVSSSETIEAIAAASGYANSNVATAVYTADFSQAATPTFSLAPGTYTTAQTVTVSDTTPGATIHYAIGAVPTTASAVYNGPITVSSPETVEAVAVADGYLNSAITTAAYNIGPNPSAEWTWMGGSNMVPADCSRADLCAQPGWYGSLQVPDAANFPGARLYSVSWTDSKGNLWLFGGSGWDSAGNQGFLNDLWEFRPSTAEWTWVSGSKTIPSCDNLEGCGPSGLYGTLGTPASTNTPGSRENAVGWIDNKGSFWLFGGLGFDASGQFGFLNDLWEFSPTTDEWTWIAGSDSVPCFQCGRSGVYGEYGAPAAGNFPGSRAFATTWTDHNGNLWMFGGQGEDARGEECYLNDLWEYNTSTAEWAWRNGNNLCSDFVGGYPGVYGTVGVPAIGDIPWSLIFSASWTDSNGNLWLFGGFGFDPFGDSYYLNDMWEFLPSVNEWAWTSANSSSAPGGSENGVYGTMGDWSPANIPGERFGSESWTDGNGNFWILGGAGNTNLQNPLDDLWEFKPSLNEWAWMGGNSTVPSGNLGAPGQYGTLGTPAPGNAPGGRAFAATWTDDSGNLWFFGGRGNDSAGNLGSLNDLWQYGLTGPPAVRPPSPASTPTFSLAAGTYSSVQTLTISDQTAGATIYYTANGTTPNASSAIYSAPIPVSTSETVEAVAVASGNAVSAIASAAYAINLPPAALPTFSVPAGTYTSAQTVSISDTTPGATIYYTTNGTTPTTGSTVYNGAIAISSTETIEAIAVAGGFENSNVASATYTINLPPTFTLGTSPSSLTVNSGSEGTATLTVTPQNGFASTVSFACSGLPSGASCGFSPTAVTPSGGNAATTQLTINVGASSANVVPASQGKRNPLAPGTTLALAGVFLLLWRRRNLHTLLLLMFVAVGLGTISGCGGGGTANGGGGGGGTTPVTSTVTVTATSGSSQQTAAIMLTVN